MKPPIIIEQLFKKRGSRKVNWEWVKYFFLIVACVATFGLLIFTVVDSVQNDNHEKDTKCAVENKSVDWKYRDYDTDPDNSNSIVWQQCFNTKNDKEVKDFPGAKNEPLEKKT